MRETRAGPGESADGGSGLRIIGGFAGVGGTGVRAESIVGDEKGRRAFAD